MRKFKIFKGIHREKLKGALAEWVEKNARPGDKFKFIIVKGNKLYLKYYVNNNNL